MIMHSFYNRFISLQQIVDLQIVLDIGAHQGDFTETVRSVWPDARIIQVEADERQRYWLEDDAIIALLGDCEQIVDFYTLPPDKITTGSSVFKELTHHYDDCLVVQKSMTTLDKLLQTHDFSGDWSRGLVKIDVQGAELLILCGATNFLHLTKPRYMLLECSVLPYNQDAPLVSEIIIALNTYGYRFIDVFDLTYDGNNRLLQLDILFERST